MYQVKIEYIKGDQIKVDHLYCDGIHKHDKYIEFTNDDPEESQYIYNIDNIITIEYWEK